MFLPCQVIRIARIVACVICATPLASLGAGKIELTAEQSAGGVLVTFADGAKGVALDSSLNVPGKSDVAIEWKLEQPLAAGWWHGEIDFGPREGDDRGWVNYHLGVVLLSSQRPMVNLMSNFHPAERAPYRFTFWMYCATPASGVRIQGVYDDLWKYKRSWPITRVTLEHQEQAAPGPDESMTLDLPVGGDGSVPLPQALPAGVWSLRAAMTKEGNVTCAGADGKEVRAPFSFDRWRRPAQICFYMASPLKGMTFKTAALFKGVVIEQTMVRPAKDAPVEGTLITTVDPAKTQTARLELIGKDLAGTPPVLATFPQGKRLAVVTTWDDGAPADLRCAEVLAKHGYHPSYFMNQNSLAMRFLDKLEALGAEVGSHTLHHPSLHALPPDQAVEECVGMRKLLERQLKHPVVSMAYPNGYTAAYDTEGDYVLRAVRAAGHWSGRTTLTGSETVDSITEPLAFKTNGFFGDAAGLERQWNEVKGTEGAVFHFWGHSWQIGKTNAQWEKFDELAAKFAGNPDAWYAAQGDLFYWIWLRKNARLEVTEKSAEKVVVQVSRPWVHPYLARSVPLTLKVPAGVTKVVWEGAEVVVTNGWVELKWAPE
jgi:hypothetical protein